MNFDTNNSFSTPKYPLCGIHGYFQHHFSQAATAAAAAAAATTAWTSGTFPNEAVATPGSSPMPESEMGTFKPKKHSQCLGSSSPDHSEASDSEPVLTDDSQMTKWDVHLNESGRKIYACTLCDFATKKKGLLKVHINTVHYNMKVYSCDLCKFISIQKGNLQAHVRTVHTKERNFACEFCEYRAGTKGILKTHVKNRHSHSAAGGHKQQQFVMGPPYECPCPPCPFRTAKKALLKHHARTTGHGKAA